MIFKKAQGWGFDIVVALTIFTIGLVFFYFFALNNSPDAESTLKTLDYEAQSFSDNLLTEGSPSNWNQTNYQQIGILSNGKINDTKLENFYNLTLENYDLVRINFGLIDNFFVNFSDSVYFNGSLVEGIGKKPLSETDLVKFSRLVILHGQPQTMFVEVWR